MIESKFDIYPNKVFDWNLYNVWSQEKIVTFNDKIDCLIQCNSLISCLTLVVATNSDQSITCIFYYLPHNLTNALVDSDGSIIYNKKIRNDSIYSLIVLSQPPNQAIYWTRQSKYYLAKYLIGNSTNWIKITNHSISDKYFRNSTTSYLGEELNTSFNDCESLCMNNTECFHFTLINETTENENKTKCILSRFTPNQNIKNISLCPANAICNSLISSNNEFSQIHRYIRNDVTTHHDNYIAFFDDITGIWTDWISP
ncbi:unnamed protein product [Brachionus calyciflorus]|uniref:Uncharacterized protein n=1 Tax=Brachionus calyciflorus TaxID=104777 RepID=A0A813RN46_9BILA|nr:unnamed protein product [Brachionus calyciflorus]